MRKDAADDAGGQHVGGSDVADVVSVSAQQPSVRLARNRCADRRGGHRGGPDPCSAVDLVRLLTVEPQCLERRKVLDRETNRGLAGLDCVLMPDERRNDEEVALLPRVRPAVDNGLTLPLQQMVGSLARVAIARAWTPGRITWMAGPGARRSHPPSCSFPRGFAWSPHADRDSMPGG